MAVLDEYGLDEELASPEFLELVRSPDQEVRASAFSVVKQVTRKGRAVLGEVIRSASDSYGYIRYLCVKILQAVDPSVLDSYLDVDVTPIAVWERELRAPDPGRRNQAVLALGAYGAVAVPLLRSALDASDPAARQLALLALARVGPPALEALGTAVGDADRDVRRQAAWALAAGGVGAAEYLVLAFRDAEPGVRETALRSAAALGHLVAPAIPAMLPLLADPDGLVSYKALAALEGLAAYSGPFAERVVEALGAVSPRLRSSPVSRVARSRNPQPEDLALLLGVLREEGDQVVRLAASVLLWSAFPTGFATTPVLNALEALAKDPPPQDYLVESMFSWFPRSGPDVVRFLPFFIDRGLRSWSAEVRNEAESWFQSLEAPEATAVPALIELLGSPNSTAQRNWPYPAIPVLLTCRAPMTWSLWLAGREAARDQAGFAAGVAAPYAVRAPVWSAPGRSQPCGSGGSLLARPAARRRR